MIGGPLPLHWFFEYLGLADVLKTEVISRALAEQIHSPQAVALWHVLNTRHGVKIGYVEEDTRVLMQVAQIAAAFPGDAWLLKDQQDVQRFIAKGCDAYRWSNVQLGHGARFSFALKASQAEALRSFLSKVQRTPWESVGERPYHETSTPVWLRVRRPQPAAAGGHCRRVVPSERVLEEADCTASLRIGYTSFWGVPELLLGLGLWWFEADGMGISINLDTGEETWYGPDPAKQALYGRRFRFTLVDHGGRPESVVVGGGFGWDELWRSNSVDEGGLLVMPPPLLETLTQLASGGPVRCFLGQC